MRHQAGFSLVELLISVAVIGLAAAAVLGVFQTSLVQTSRALALEDAQSGARAVLDGMTRELRTIGAYWTGANGAGAAIIGATPASITFLGDVDADTVSGGTEITSTASTSTTVTVSGAAGAFNVYATAALNDYVHLSNGATREVKQVTGVSGSTLTLAAPLANVFPAGTLVRSVETVTYSFDGAARAVTRRLGGAVAETLLDNVSSVSLTYFDAAGAALAAVPPSPGLIREIQVAIAADAAGGGRRTMTSRVRLRN